MLWTLTIHLVKTAACLAVFYLFYKLLLSRETLHRLNRVVILAATAAAFALPLCVVTRYRVLPAAEPVPVALLPSDALLADAAAQGTPWWQIAAGVLLLAGAAATLAATLRSLCAVRRILREGRAEPLDDGALLVCLDRDVAPFSWGRRIVIGRRDLEENGRAILAHERAHVRLHHSCDLLFFDLAACLQWFNPAVWLLRRELRALHEYEADEAVLDSGVDARAYQLLLIKKAAGERWYSVANSFNHSKLKNRITMMLQKRSSRWAGAKALLVLPLAGIALGAFAETVYVVSDDKGTNKREQKQAESLFLPSESTFDEREQKQAESLILSGDSVVQKHTKSTTVVVTGSGSENVVVRDTDDPNGPKPLYVVDGKEMANLDGIDVTRIASVSVLKSATAVEQYGERAKAGVIIVTTRSADEAADGKGLSGLSGSMRSISVSTSSSADGADPKVVVISDKRGGTRSTTTTTTTTTTGDGEVSSETIRITDDIGVKNGTEFGGGKAKSTSTTTAISIDPDGKTSTSEIICITGDITVKDGTEFADALILIDGKESTQRQLSKLDPKKIKEIQIFKGQGAVERYGEKGAHGAVVVTTNKK